MNVLNPKLLLVIAFLEGMVVLAVELLGAKMLAPIYGASLLVWTSAIGVTLFSLAVGYFIGGTFSTKRNLQAILYYELVLAALFILLMPLIASTVMMPLYHLGRDLGPYQFHFGMVSTCFLLLGPPLLLLGMVSPVVIRLAAKEVKLSGKISGTVYGISTLGGIFVSFMLGFYIIPRWGITYPVFVFAALLMGGAALVMKKNKWIESALFALLIIIYAGWSFNVQNNYDRLSGGWLKYKSEGLLGQLKVVDTYHSEDTSYRQLMINGISQTVIINNEEAPSYWKYVHLLSSFSTLKPTGSEVLLFGFAGGSVAKEMIQLGMHVDAVDIDERMFSIAERFFYCNDLEANYIIDDARHYINTCQKKYDIVIFDLSTAEVQPSNVFTLESFSRLKDLLNEGALIMINFQEYMETNEGEAFQAIYKTLVYTGFQTYYCYYENLNLPYDVDILFLASEKGVNFKELSKEKMNTCCSVQDYTDDLLANPVSMREVNISDAPVLRDNAPLLEHLNLHTTIDWRSYLMKMNTGGYRNP